ncbi:MAG: metallophosphoesterase [Cyanobacteria bacterium J06635_11]
MHRILSGALSVEEHKIPITNLPDRLAGTVVAHLSDFHFDGLRLSNSLLAKTLDYIHTLKPDLIALTGDFVTRDPSPIHELARRLAPLPSRYGTVAVLGNHDIKERGARGVVTKALEQADISVLWNEIATPMGEDFPIVGFADYWSQEFDPAVLARLSPDVARLVLSHNPDTAENLAEWRVDLQLSGHTHGGQVYIPGFGSGPLVWRRLRQRVPRPIRNSIPFLSDKCFHTVRHWEWGQGLHQVNGNWLYVNRGLGTYYPGRFFCPPELTVLTLEKG